MCHFGSSNPPPKERRYRKRAILPWLFLGHGVTWAASHRCPMSWRSFSWLTRSSALVANLGDPGNSITLFSAIPRGAIVAACGAAVTVNGPLTPLAATQVGLVWRLSRRVMAFRAGVAEEQFVDEDP